VKGRYGAGNGMRKQLHELGYNCDQFGFASPGPHDIARDEYISVPVFG
jgi:hypothetical protein